MSHFSDFIDAFLGVPKPTGGTPLEPEPRASKGVSSGDRGVIHGEEMVPLAPPTKVDVPMPPVKPPEPELSCLARGIIDSIQNESSQWRKKPHSKRKSPDQIIYAHRKSGLEVVHGIDCAGGYCWLSHGRISSKEGDLIWNALFNHLELPGLKRRQAAAERKAKAILAVFEKRGCPQK